MEFTEDDDKLFREMDVDEDGLPVIGPSNSTLGVRTHGRLVDIKVDENGKVRPPPTSESRRGMSVAPRTPMNLSELHLPPELGGEGTYPVWCISKSALDSAALLYQETSTTHGRIAPAREMTLREFEEAIEATREAWSRVVG